MKPIKGLLPFVLFFLRISIVFFSAFLFIPEVKTYNFGVFHYYIPIFFMLFSFLLFIGMFLKKNTLTIFSGFMLFFVSVYKVFDLFEPDFQGISFIFVFIAFISLIFVSLGNKNK